MNFIKNLGAGASSKIKAAPRATAKYVSDLAGRSPEFSDKLKQIFNFKLADPANKHIIRDGLTTAGKNSGTFLGGSAGAVLNPDLGLKNDDGSSTYGNRLLNIIGGGLSGRAIGSAAGRRMGTAVPTLLPKIFGRVATNTGYPGFSQAAPDASLRDLFKAVRTDKPINASVPDDSKEFFTRKMFGLDPRGEAANYAKQVGANKYKLNPEHAGAKAVQDNLTNKANKSNLSPEELQDLISSNSYKTNAGGLEANVNSKGLFSATNTYGGDPAKMDFSTPEGVAKGFANMFSKPVTDTLEGVANTPARAVKGVDVSNPAIRKVVQGGLASKATTAAGGTNTADAMELLTKTHLGDAARDSKAFDPKIHQQLLSQAMRDPKTDILQRLADLQSTKGTGNSLKPGKRWKIEQNKVHAFGPHDVDTLRGPGGKPWSGPGLANRVKKNMTTNQSGLTPEEKKEIIKKINAQDPEMTALAQTDPYFKKELDIEIAQAMAKALGNKSKTESTFQMPNIVSKADLTDLLGTVKSSHHIAILYPGMLKQAGMPGKGLLSGVKKFFSRSPLDTAVGTGADILSKIDLPKRSVDYSLAKTFAPGRGTRHIYDATMGTSLANTGIELHDRVTGKETSMSDRLKLSLGGAALPLLGRLSSGLVEGGKLHTKLFEDVMEGGFTQGSDRINALDKINSILSSSKLSAKEKIINLALHKNEIKKVLKADDTLYTQYLSPFAGGTDLAKRIAALPQDIRDQVYLKKYPSSPEARKIISEGQANLKRYTKSLRQYVNSFGINSMDGGYVVNRGMPVVDHVKKTVRQGPGLATEYLNPNSAKVRMAKNTGVKRFYGVAQPEGGDAVPFNYNFA
jgi:hypothetical protein